MLRESGLAAEALVGFILDLDALCVVVQSAIEGLTAVASVAKKAMARLKEQHLAVYLEKLLETDFFKAVMAVVTNLVQVSAKDEVARSKLQRAVEILADTRLPRMVAPSMEGDMAETRIVNVGMVMDSSCIECLIESLCLVVEATKLWTVAKMEASVHEVREWAEKAMGKLCFYNYVVWLFLQALLSRHAVGDLLWPQVHPAVDYEGKESKGSEGNPQSGSIASLARYLDDNMVDNMVARGTE